ncbi:enoyl-CoA hydratase [Cupriavidus basilensis OR16]|uniref:Enoyl-CoA hydratase n=1 Tax=Cupriavidus basilensis OR16 TaxID=1127483 RepID=H1SAZ0_9BURK|nr:enoyl-CoA hydratase [Cupriavidus basilensis]EHP40322.1 enoyl-CoA hydratase [Cupriavidus basilensis OR16]
MQYATIEIEQLGAVRRLWLARENARNAQSQQMLDELDHAMQEAAADDTVRVVVIAGRGQHFSAGHDLKEAQAKRADFTVEERWSYESVRYFDYCMRIWDFPKPTIAQVQGACVSGGFMIANMCDLVVAGDSAYFSDPVGHTLGAAATEVLIHPWVMGLRKAKEMLYTGGRVDATEALRIGLVNRVVPDAELGAETEALAARIAQAPPFGLRLIKRSLNRTLDAQGLRGALSAHFDTHQLSHLSEGFLRARDAGLAKAIIRDPARAGGNNRDTRNNEGSEHGTQA